MSRIISILMAFVTFFSSPMGYLSNKAVEPASTDNFVPVVRFIACSDTHVTEYYEESDRAGRITKLLNLGYEFAENDEYYNSLDAIMMAGDVTDNGTEKQFEILGSELNAGLRGDTQVLAVVASNHDGYVGEVCRDRISAITGLDADFHVVINGFHFIGVSAGGFGLIRYTEAQRQWLREQLEEAQADDPDKPIFVCNHEHVLSTVYGSDPMDEWGTPILEDILSDFPQVVHFSGHSHYPLNDPRSVVQGKFTTVGTGSMSYAEFRYFTDIKIRPSDNGKDAQAWIVEADADNNVRLTGIDVTTGGTLCQYVIPTKADSDERVFTRTNMMKISSAPAFSSDASLGTVDNGDGTYTVTAPAAKATDGFVVFAYRITVYDKAGLPIHTEYTVNDYYTTDSYKQISFTVDAKAGYKVEVTAENAYYMSSAPLSATLG